MPGRPQIRGNPVARSPLLRRGGAHERSRSGQRQQSRRQLDVDLDEWFDEQEDIEIPHATEATSHNQRR